MPFNPIGPSPFDSDGVEPTSLVAKPVVEAISQAGDIRAVLRGGVDVEQVFVPAGSFLIGFWRAQE